jgi:hypothetical protein
MSSSHNIPVSKSLLESMQLLRDCPGCQQPYNHEMVQVIDEHRGAHLVHAVCEKCALAVLAVVMISELGMSSIGMTTDLSSDDVVRLRQRPPLGQDDVLQLHTFLRAYEGRQSCEEVFSVTKNL